MNKIKVENILIPACSLSASAWASLLVPCPRIEVIKVRTVKLVYLRVEP